MGHLARTRTLPTYLVNHQKEFSFFIKNCNGIFLGLIEVRSARQKLRVYRNWKNITYCRRPNQFNIRSKVPILFSNYFSTIDTAVWLAMLQL